MRTPRKRTPLKASDLSLSEKDFQRLVIECAQRGGWRVFHARKAQGRDGKWVTAVAADGAGFPDLVLARAGEILFAELKTARGKMTDAQVAWEKQLTPHHKLWRPQDWNDIQAFLLGRR